MMTQKPQEGIGQVGTGVSFEQKEAIIIDIKGGAVSIKLSEAKRVDTAIMRDVIVGGLNAYLKELDIKCLQELKHVNEGI